MSSLIMKRDDAVVVEVDYQDGFVPVIYDHEKLETRLVQAIRGFRILDVPIIATTQYAKGLGNTTAAVAEALGDFVPIDKRTFSCTGCPEFMEALEEKKKKSVILIGIETHICVQQTALYLMEKGYSVYLIADCLSARFRENHERGLARLANSGATVTTLESILFELLVDSRDPAFRGISDLVKEIQ